jgi:hypothetical protein
MIPNPSLSSISDFFANATKLLRGGQEQKMKNIHLFFDKLVSLLNEKREDDRDLASDFNVFDYIQPDELKLSRIIADLLDPKGSHGQQRICLEAFVEAMIERISEEQPLRQKLTKLQKVVRDDKCFVIVQTEVATSNRRRMDIVVNVGGNDGIVLENKPWANDQKEQLGDYADEAAKRFDCWVLIYLHGTGKAADEYTISKNKLRKLEADGNFFNADYIYFLIRWLKICLERVEAEKLRCFLRDFIDYIEIEFRIDFFNGEINNV